MFANLEAAIRSFRSSAVAATLIVAVTVFTAGCAVSSDTSLPLLPPPPSTSTGTFVIQNSASCPAGSTASNPLAGNCSIATATGTVEVLPDMFLGGAYTAVVQTRGGILPASFCQVQNVPAGITLSATVATSGPNAGSCVITGTIPSTVPGLTVPPGGFATFQVSVNVRDSSNPAASATANMIIRVFAGFSFNTSTLENGTQGRAYTKIITSNLAANVGVPPMTSCTSTTLPTGLSVAPFGTTSCRITGTPSVNGSFTVTIDGTDNGGNTRSVTLPLVINPVLALSTPTYAAGTAGRAFTAVTLTRTGGQTPVTCSDGGTLPAGMTVAASANNCVVSGTPTASGTFNVIITATDTATTDPAQGGATVTASGTATATASMTINPGLAITTVANTILDGVATRTYVTPAFTNTGGNAPFTWSATGLGSGACTGLTMSAAGVVSGTPTTAGVCNFTAIVTDTATASTPAGNTSSPFTITVRPEYALAAPAFVDGVEQRTYGNAPQVHLVNTTPAVAATAGASDFGAAENGNGPLVTCQVTNVAVSSGSPTTPLTTANFSTTVVDPSDGSRCRIESNGAFPAGSAATYNITVSVTDNAIGAFAPAATKTSTGTMIVQPALALNANLADPLPDAATGRSYGVGNVCGAGGAAACTPVIYTASGGIAPYSIAVTGGAFPAGFSLVSGATTLTASAATVTAGAGGPTAITVSVTDAGNTAVPAAPGVPVTVVRNITVQPDVTLTPNAAGAAPPDGVVGRTYGNTGGGFSALVYTASGGLGGFVYTAIPSLAAPGSGVPAAVACTPAAAVMTCTSGAAVVTAGPGAYTYIVRVSDTGNVSTPGRGFSALGSQALGPLNLAIQPALTLTPSAAAATVALPDAVEGRSWGQGAGCSGGACLPAIYTATGGLGATTSYSYSVTSPFPGGAGAFPCVASATSVPGDTLTCSTAAVASGAGAFPAAFTPTVALDDTANATTPGASASGTTPAPSAHTMTVNAPMSWTLNFDQNGNPVAATTAADPVTLPFAVDGRPVGVSAFDGTRNPVRFSGAGGLNATFSFATSTGFSPSPFSCYAVPPAPPNSVQCDTTRLNPAAVIPLGASAASPYVQNISATDGANASTPGQTLGFDFTLIVRPALALAGGSPAPTSSPLPTARQNSPYGTGSGCSGGACVPVTFTVNPGTGLPGAAGVYSFGSSGFPAGIGCSAAVNVLTCSSANVTAPGGPFTPQVTIDDTANAITPTHAAVNGSPFTVNETMTVVNDLVIDAGGTFTFTGGNGTINRAFGTGTGIGSNPPNVEVGFTGGISTFTCSGNAAFTTLGLVATTVGNNCRITGTPNSSAGPFNLTITVTDSNNQSTPTDTSTTANKPLTVNAALTLSAPTLAVGVTGQAYTSSVSTNTAGGQTPYTWLITGAGIWGAPVAGIQSGVATTNCEGLTFNTATGAFGGTPTTAGTCGPFTITADDTTTNTTGNASATVGAPAQLVSITVNAPVSLAPWAGGPEDSATEGRPIGGGSGGPLDYVISGGSGSFTCSAFAGLPVGTGLSVTQTAPNRCRLQGTPTAADRTQFQGVNTVTIRVTDNNTSQTADQVTAAFVVNLPLSINGDTTTTAQVYPIGVRTLFYGGFDVQPAGGNQGTPPVLTNPGGGATLKTGDANCDFLALLGSNLQSNPGNLANPTAGTCTFNLAVNDIVTNMSAAATLTQNNNTLQIIDPLSITTVQANLVNGLRGASYNAGNNITFTTNNGGAGGALVWFDNADAAGASCAVPTGAIPTGLTFTSAGVLQSGTLTASSATTADFTFEICVESPGNAAVTPYSTVATFTINVMDRYVYVADPSADRVNVIDSRTNTEVDTDGGGSPFAIALTAGDNPEDVAVSLDGRRAFVTANGANVVRVIDTISHAVIDTVTLGSCTGPRGIAIERVSGSTDRAYVACTNGRAATFDPSAAIPIGAASVITFTGSAGMLDDVTFRANAAHDRAYFTDNTNDRIYAIDTTNNTEADLDSGTAATHFALPVTTGNGSSVRGALSVANGANIYLYLAMSAQDSGNDTFVQVLNVNTDSPTTVSGTPVNVGNNFNNIPLYFAFDATNNIVYVSRNGNDDITQINNAVATPARSATGTTGAPTGAYGVTIPPVTGRVYVSGNGSDSVDHFALTAFGTAPSGGASINLDGATTPRRIKHIPIPR